MVAKTIPSTVGATHANHELKFSHRQRSPGIQAGLGRAFKGNNKVDESRGRHLIAPIWARLRLCLYLAILFYGVASPVAAAKREASRNKPKAVDCLVRRNRWLENIRISDRSDNIYFPNSILDVRQDGVRQPWPKPGWCRADDLGWENPSRHFQIVCDKCPSFVAGFILGTNYSCRLSGCQIRSGSSSAILEINANEDFLSHRRKDCVVYPGHWIGPNVRAFVLPEWLFRKFDGVRGGIGRLFQHRVLLLNFNQGVRRNFVLPVDSKASTA